MINENDWFILAIYFMHIFKVVRNQGEYREKISQGLKLGHIHMSNILLQTLKKALK